MKSCSPTELKKRIFGESIDTLLDRLVEAEKLPVLEAQERPEAVMTEPLKEHFILYKSYGDTFEFYERAIVEYGDTSFDVYVPTGVIVRRVPQHILGRGVLGRAFIHQNYIEILDTLHGDAYQEVLTHEVLHIQYPEETETAIRRMTRQHIRFTIYN